MSGDGNWHQAYQSQTGHTWPLKGARVTDCGPSLYSLSGGRGRGYAQGSILLHMLKCVVLHASYSNMWSKITYYTGFFWLSANKQKSQRRGGLCINEVSHQVWPLADVFTVRQCALQLFISNASSALVWEIAQHTTLPFCFLLWLKGKHKND